MTVITVLAAMALGYLWGSLPTANTLARLRGIDLRQGGSGNPGANNARRLGGPALGALVLTTEMAKGFLAVWIPGHLGGDLLATFSGAAAIAGNVFNPWYRFRGGQGLGITAGVLVGAWPWSAATAVLGAAGAALLMRSAPAGGLTGLAMALAGLLLPPGGWGLARPAAAWLILVAVAIAGPKQVINLRRRVPAEPSHSKSRSRS